MHNVAASAGLQVLTMVSGIIVPRLMLVYYGSEINGLVSSIVQFISYFNIVEVGAITLFTQLMNHNGRVYATRYQYCNVLHFGCEVTHFILSHQEFLPPHGVLGNAA